MRVESVGRPKRRVARSPVARIAFQWFSFVLSLSFCRLKILRTFFTGLLILIGFSLSNPFLRRLFYDL